MSFIEITSMFDNTQIILLNIVILRSSWAKNVYTGLYGDLTKIRQVKLIISTKVYDKFFTRNLK